MARDAIARAGALEKANEAFQERGGKLETKLKEAESKASSLEKEAMELKAGQANKVWCPFPWP